MPRMDKQVRLERARRLEQLRFEKKLSPAGAWREAAPDSKAKNPAELCRREIRWLRDQECLAEAAGEDDDDPAVGPNGASPNGTSAEVTGAAAAKPTKRCLGAGDKPCGKKVSGQSPRCEPCRAEHERLKRQVQNRASNLRNKEARKKRRLEKEERQRQEEANRRRQEEERRRQEAAEKRRQEEERQRQEEAARKKAEADAFVAELRAEAEAKRKARPKLPLVTPLGDGRSLTTYPDGRRTLDREGRRSIELKPGEPIPPRPPIKFADDKLTTYRDDANYNWAGYIPGKPRRR